MYVWILKNSEDWIKVYQRNSLCNCEVLSTACEQALSSFEHDAEYTSRIEDSVVRDFVFKVTSNIFRMLWSKNSILNYKNSILGDLTDISAKT